MLGAVYEDLRALSPTPQLTNLTRPTVRQEETQILNKSDGSVTNAPTRKHHLLSDTSGNFPIGRLNDWETRVLSQEANEPGFVAWYRNPSTPSQDSLAVSYQDGSGRWRSLRPDFIFFSRTADGELHASIVDPHSLHLSDALPKLKGLADFVDSHGDAYHRIESVAKVGNELRVLDLKDTPTRTAVRAADTADSVFSSEHSRLYLTLPDG